MRILGIDPPSLKNLGYAIADEQHGKIKIVKCGVFTLPDSFHDEVYEYDFAVKCKHVREAIHSYIHDTTLLVLEQPIISKTSNRFTPPFILAQTTLMASAIEQVAIEHNIKRIRVHPKTCKKIITGNGNSSKKDILDIIESKVTIVKILSNSAWLKKYEHMYDAIALCSTQGELVESLPIHEDVIVL